MHVIPETPATRSNAGRRSHPRAAVALGLAFMIAAPATWADDAVRTPRLQRAGDVDAGSVESIVATLIRSGSGQREKALAVYDYLRGHVFHWGLAREQPDRRDFEYGVVYDPVKLINVYGYGLCFQNRAAAEALWQAAGLEARSAGVGGHAVAEVFYDGRYHWLDADQHGFCLLPDGTTIASIDDVSRDPWGLLLAPPRRPRPFFPSGDAPKAPYESRVLCASYFATRGDNFYQHDKVVTGHRMDVTLLPGMRYERRFTGDGRWNIDNESAAGDYKLGIIDPRVGPRDPLTGRTYGNGNLRYQPDLTSRSEEYAAGVWADENVRVTETGLAPAAPGKPAWSVFRIRTPYVIVGWPTSFVGPANVRGAAVVAAEFHREADDGEQGLDLSVDGGRTWTPVWTHPGTGVARPVVDLGDTVAARYEYLLRVRLGGEKAAGSRLSSLAIDTAFQLAPRSLPALAEGSNEMLFSLGDETETLERVVDMGGAAGLAPDAFAQANVRLEDGRLRADANGAGELILELKPPRPGTAVGFHVDVGCRRTPGELHPEDDIAIFRAEDEPTVWTPLADDEVPPETGHWSYHLTAAGRCAAGTRRVFLKIRIRTADNAGVNRIHWRLFWKPAGSGGMPARGLRLEHHWTEHGVAKQFTTVATTASHRYDVPAGSGLRNIAVVMEPVRTLGLRWRENDPPVAAPPVPTQEVVDAAARDELRRLLRAIDAAPAEALPEAARSSITWLATNAKAAQVLLAARDPRPPAGADRADPLADEAGRKAAALVMAGTDIYAKLDLLAAIHTAQAAPLPDFVIGGLQDASSLVRAATLAAVRASGDRAARRAVAALVDREPRAWLHAEAESVLRTLDD